MRYFLLVAFLLIASLLMGACTPRSVQRELTDARLCWMHLEPLAVDTFRSWYTWTTIDTMAVHLRRLATQDDAPYASQLFLWTEEGPPHNRTYFVCYNCDACYSSDAPPGGYRKDEVLIECGTQDF